jgi:hypothetical protein
MTREGVRAARRGGFRRGFLVLTRGSRPRETVCSFTPESASHQFRYSALQSEGLGHCHRALAPRQHLALPHGAVGAPA